MGTLIRKGNGDLYESTVEDNCIVYTNEDILRRGGGEEIDNAEPQHRRKAANDLRNARVELLLLGKQPLPHTA